MENLTNRTKSPGRNSSGSSQSDHTPLSGLAPAKESVGSLNGLQQFLKLHDALKSAYTNFQVCVLYMYLHNILRPHPYFQVSISPLFSDKFSHMLSVVHSIMACVLEVALADEIGHHVEELISYLSVTLLVDAPGSFLCLQQLLNALFGMNVATQQTHLYSPYLSSLPYTLQATLSPPLPRLFSSQMLYAIPLIM